MTDKKVRITQLVHTLSYGDAISSEVLSLHRVIDNLGYDSKIVCLNIHPKFKDAALFFHRGGEEVGEHSDLVILHYSIGSSLNSYFESLKVPRALIYHNVTPPDWFENCNVRVSEDIRDGLKSLPKCVHCSDFLISDSEFNARDLRFLTDKKIEVLPLVVDPLRFDKPANSGISRALKGHGGSNILHVGRIAPNKCIEDVIKTFYFYHHKIQKKSKLWLVGSDIDTEFYQFELRRLVSELRLDSSVEFVGSVSDDELRAFYEYSDCYLVMSEHEGFCVPLIEAMSFKLPVVAFSQDAICETLGDSGILFKKKEFALISEVINLITEDRGFKDKLVSSGLSRVDGLSFENFEKRAKELIKLALDQSKISTKNSTQYLDNSNIRAASQL